MNNQLRVAVLLIAATALFSCSQKQSAPPPPPQPEQAAPPVVGGDRDEHGCIGSAGYTWSAAAKNCLRLFETGTRLIPAKGDGTTSAFIVFSDDKKLCELFVPGEKGGKLLDRHPLGKGECWGTADTYIIRSDKGRWVCEQRGEMVFAQPVK